MPPLYRSKHGDMLSLSTMLKNAALLSLLSFFISINAIAAEKRGLFISAITAAEVTALPRYINAVKKATSPSYSSTINSYVFSPISSNKGFAHRSLDSLLPIIKDSDEIYIGTNWMSNSELHLQDTYCGQLVFNKTFAEADAQASARVAEEFVQRYPNVNFSWYVTAENFLNHLALGCHAGDAWNNTYVDGPTLSKALGKYLNTWTRALNDVKLSNHFLWSPSCPETSYRTTSNMSRVYRAKLLEGLVILLNEVPLLDTLVLQDAIGKASNVSIQGDIQYGVVANDTILHANMAQEAMVRVGRGERRVRINMEMFIRSGRRIPASAIVDMVSDPIENNERVKEYNNAGFHLGPSWEIQDWYKQTIVGKNWTSKCRQWSPCKINSWAPPCCKQYSDMNT